MVTAQVPRAVEEATRATDALPVDPAVVGAVAVVVLLVAALVLRQVVRRYRLPGRRLRRVLSRPDSVAVLMHPNPDPDAMACALGVAEIAREAGTEPELLYPGQIRHQENRAFRTVLDLDFEKIESTEDITAERVVLVDHNEPRGFAGAERITPLAVIDHHPGGGTGSAFTDVRTDYGACASVVAEYFQHLGVEAVPPDTEERPNRAIPTEVATGLLYGILADTNHLTKGCSVAEFEASEYLYPATDDDLLDRIANPQVDEEILDVKARAITGREVDPPYCISHVGEVSNVDAIPQAADELINLEGVTAVVVMGRKDSTLHMSGRSRDDRVHMGNALSTVVEDIPMSGAGGHARMGGGQLSVDHMEGIGPSGGITESELKERLFRAMEGDV